MTETNGECEAACATMGRNKSECLFRPIRSGGTLGDHRLLGFGGEPFVRPIERTLDDSLAVLKRILVADVLTAELSDRRVDGELGPADVRVLRDLDGRERLEGLQDESTSCGVRRGLQQ